jgi:hypothetical protein
VKLLFIATFFVLALGAQPQTQAQVPSACTSCTDLCATQRDACGSVACAAVGGKWINKYCQNVPFGKNSGYTGKLKGCSNKAEHCVERCQESDCRAAQ